MRPVILTCALTGNLTRPEQTPHLPITPVALAEEALAAADAGAAVVHIHVRDPVTGAPSMALDLYQEVCERIRSARPSLLLNLTTGPGGRYVPNPANPREAAPETTLLPAAKRVEHVLALRPEIATLDLNTMNSGDMVVMNTRHSTRVMAEAMLAAGVRPEIELFNAGDQVLALELLDSLDFPSPALFSLVLGVRYGWPALLESVQLAQKLLPPGAIWTAFGVGRHAFPMLAQSVLLGGHVRIGLEDTIYLERGVLAPGNGPLCEKAARMVHDLGARLATPAEARNLLGISSP